MEVVEYYMDDAPDVHIVQNPLNDAWFIEGQKNESLPYVRDTFAQASKMYQAIKYFNATGEPKTEDKFGALPKSRFKKRKTIRGQRPETETKNKET